MLDDLEEGRFQLSAQGMEVLSTGRAAVRPPGPIDADEDAQAAWAQDQGGNRSVTGKMNNQLGNAEQLGNAGIACVYRAEVVFPNCSHFLIVKIIGKCVFSPVKSSWSRVSKLFGQLGKGAPWKTQCQPSGQALICSFLMPVLPSVPNSPSKEGGIRNRGLEAGSQKEALCPRP